MENHHPSTLLSMDSSASSSHNELDLDMYGQIVLTRPPDINLPLSVERSPPPQPWNPEHCDILDVGLGSQMNKTESFLSVPKVGRKCAKRIDSIWGSWFFFNFYFEPVPNEKSKAKIIRDGNRVYGFDKSDLKTDLVQHDMDGFRNRLSVLRKARLLTKLLVLQIDSKEDRIGSASKLLRYPLRSATKPKEEKPPLVYSSNFSTHKRSNRYISEKLLIFPQRKLEEDGQLLPEFADAEERELFEALNLQA
ncbi:HSP20-like chaperones superfamily protein [Abeliophyllum distichum]|uniref:HSP20-like chaperones superfamily protein n=1 Tax=Abeliophyllum distichum TaxID=126358 RepID=A0ABD1QKQ6_9LAMI